MALIGIAKDDLMSWSGKGTDGVFGLILARWEENLELYVQVEARSVPNLDASWGAENPVGVP